MKSAVVYVLILVPLAGSSHIYVHELQNVTQNCPSGPQEVTLDRSSMSLVVEVWDAPGNRPITDFVTVTAINGDTQTFPFPGCYRIQLSFRLNRPITNPYVELFIQLGKASGCHSREQNMISNICTNISDANWCPQSQNEEMRRMLDGKKACRICNLCSVLASKRRGGREDFIGEEPTVDCESSDNFHKITFKMCTPNKRTFTRLSQLYEQNYDDFFDNLKEGTFTAVIHVAERREVDEEHLRLCQRLCKTFTSRSYASESYKSSLLRSVEQLCAPKDRYVACVYHIHKFTVSGDFVDTH